MDISEIMKYFWNGEKIRRAGWAKESYVYLEKPYIIHSYVVPFTTGDKRMETKVLVSEPAFDAFDVGCTDWELWDEGNGD